MNRVLAVITALLIFTSSVCADNWGPWEVPAPQTPTEQRKAEKSPLQLAIKLFQKHISPVDGPRCPMYPTCSAYALQALHEHGPLVGTFQAVDRLFREGDAEHEHVQSINKWGHVRFYDPLENNAFWLGPK